MGAEVVHAQVASELHAAEKSKGRIGRDLVERRGHRLDLLVIRGDAGAHEPVGRRHPVVHVHLDHETRRAEQLVRGVEPGGTGPDDRDAQRLRLGAGSRHLAVGLPCSSVSSIWRFSTSPR